MPFTRIGVIPVVAVICALASVFLAGMSVGRYLVLEDEARRSDVGPTPPPGTGLDLSDLVGEHALSAAAYLWDRCALGTWPGCEADGAEVLIGCRYDVPDIDRMCLIVVEAPLCATPRGDK